MRKVFMASIVLSVALIAGCMRERASQGLSCGIIADKHSVATGEVVNITFIVTNATRDSVEVPVPDTGTLSFNTVVTPANQDDAGVDGHTALAANPGRADLWTKLGPSESRTYRLSYSWQTPGTREVYFRYYSRFEDKPFKTMETAKEKIVVTK